MRQTELGASDDGDCQAGPAAAKVWATAGTLAKPPRGQIDSLLASIRAA